ncbi:MAG TPA: hypothetical protein VMY16_09470 [Ilumatobacteraceae bacterium]|nr:hypothetical protein [Ilumatobacteraceae bacterium]HUV18012.1 hypothetical protein [Ilumatobacteraceae bacterium]
MRTHLADRKKIGMMLTVLGSQGEYVVDVEKVDSSSVNLITMHESDEPPGHALTDAEVLAHGTKAKSA